MIEGFESRREEIVKVLASSRGDIKDWQGAAEYADALNGLLDAGVTSSELDPAVQRLSDFFSNTGVEYLADAGASGRVSSVLHRFETARAGLQQFGVGTPTVRQTPTARQTPGRVNMVRARGR